MNLRFFKHFAAAFALAAAATTAQAQLLVEDFNYTGLLTANGWTAHSGSGTQAIDTTTGLTYTGYPGSGVGNAANLDNNGEDVSRAFTQVTSGSVYYSFLLSSSALSAGYFTHFKVDLADVANFRARVLQSNDGTGNYELGLGFGGAALGTTNLDLAFNTTYAVVVKYTVVPSTGNDTISLFVFTGGAIPTTEPVPTLGPFSEPATADINPGAIGLRQYSVNERFIVDGIRVGTSWGGGAAGLQLPVELSTFMLD